MLWYAYFCYAPKTKNPRKVLIYRDFLCFAILSSGETGLWTFLPKILMNQHFNSVQFFKCNDLVTENCLFVSLIDLRLSKLYHYITKIHFPVHNSKSYFLFYAFYIVLYTLLKTATVRCTEADFRKDTSKEMSTMTTMSQMTQPSSWTYLFILVPNGQNR